LTGPAQQREEILSALEQLLERSEFRRSPQLGKFLSYIVRRTLDGDEQSIKAYAIAVDVFGRGSDFDPQTDPIVRVQARRLRALLSDYNEGPGKDQAVQIHLPVGRYVPEFVSAAKPGEIESGASPASLPSVTMVNSPPRRWSFAASWFLLAFITLAVAMAAYSTAVWRPPYGSVDGGGVVQVPSITVVEFEDRAGAAEARPQVAGLAIELVTDLEQFGNILVRYGGGGQANIAVADLPTSDYILTGVVEREGDLVNYSAFLTDSRSGLTVWNLAVVVPPADAVFANVLDRVSRSLSLVLGSPRGPLHAVARQYIASGAMTGNEDSPYLCRVLFDLYRETGWSKDAEDAYGCYLRLQDEKRETAEALAAIASLLMETTGGDGAASAEDRARIAEANLERAIGQQPLNAFVWEQQGRFHLAKGEFSLARADFMSSVQINPASVDALAAFAQLLAYAGQLDAAERMARDAAERSPRPPEWYFGVPTLLALRDGKYSAALIDAELYARAEPQIGSVLSVVAGLAVGDEFAVSRSVRQVEAISAFRAAGILPSLLETITDDALIERIAQALTAAGIPEEALNGPF
jgi:tetratricopeptide (TPR) repeat protein/TolB-like protein